jgi:hypothetical protein
MVPPADRGIADRGLNPAVVICSRGRDSGREFMVTEESSPAETAAVSLLFTGKCELHPTNTIAEHRARKKMAGCLTDMGNICSTNGFCDRVYPTNCKTILDRYLFFQMPCYKARRHDADSGRMYAVEKL